MPRYDDLMSTKIVNLNNLDWKTLFIELDELGSDTNFNIFVAIDRQFFASRVQPITSEM